MLKPNMSRHCNFKEMKQLSIYLTKKLVRTIGQETLRQEYIYKQNGVLLSYYMAQVQMTRPY